jgi:alpha-D-ribose 1-methylphosphonate 5-triphosphate synthase subunit PhnI
MRGDEGYLLALAYSTQRGYGRNHPFAGEIRSGYVAVKSSRKSWVLRSISANC